MIKLIRNIREHLFGHKRPIVIWQKPNAPLLLWLTATTVSKLMHGVAHDLLSLIAFGSLFTWAFLEITDGANNFRRILGILVLVMTLYSRMPS